MLKIKIDNKKVKIHSIFIDYLISPTGDIFSLKRNRWLHPYKDSHGYFQVSLFKNKKRADKLVHHLVLEMYGEPRQKGQVARHLNGNKIDNRIGNLAWGTRKENVEDMRRHDQMPNHRGESNGRAKLTERKVKLIRRLRSKQKKSLWFLARKFDMSLYAIWAIVTRRTWRHI